MHSLWPEGVHGHISFLSFENARVYSGYYAGQGTEPQWHFYWLSNRMQHVDRLYITPVAVYMYALHVHRGSS